MAGPFNVQTPGTVPGVASALPVPKLDWAHGTRILLSTAGALSLPAYSSTRDYIYEACANQNCWYTVNATATIGAAGNQYLGAGALRYIYVPAGQTISAIPDTTNGYLMLIPT